MDINNGFWDIYAPRSSGQFPSGTPMGMIVDHANYRYGNRYTGIAYDPNLISKRNQGDLSFNTNLGLVAVGPSAGLNPDVKVGFIPPSGSAGSGTQDLVVGTEPTEPATEPPPAIGIGGGFTMQPWMWAGIGLVGVLLLKKFVLK